MIREISVAVALMGITACATSGTGLSESAANTENGMTKSNDVVAASEAQAATVAGDGSEIVCRREAKMGSRLKIRICRTRSQMELEQEAAERMLRDNELRSSGGLGSE